MTDDERLDAIADREIVFSVTSVASAEYGGWMWQAEGPDRPTAIRRLNDRLHLMSPFHGEDTDWGPPGRQVGELTDELPADLREHLTKYEQRLRELSEGPL